MSCFLNYSWQRCRCIFILFFHIQIFFWFNFRYVAKPFYLKIGKSCLISCFGIAEIKNRPVVFTSTFLRKNPLTRQTRNTFNRSRANLNGPILVNSILSVIQLVGSLCSKNDLLWSLVYLFSWQFRIHCMSALWIAIRVTYILYTI